MGHEAIVLDEGAFIEQEIEPFARRELALVVLGLDAGSAAPFFGLGSSAFQQFESLAHGHGREK
ncbi:hypothetical protein D3C83_218180 [compost metagenome]